MTIAHVAGAMICYAGCVFAELGSRVVLNA